MEEIEQEKGNVIFPRYTAIRGEIYFGKQVAKIIVTAAKFEFCRIGLVMQIPTKDDGAKP
jgi:hypothetical protein